MHAILISEDNFDKIKEEVNLDERDTKFLKTCFNKDRYFVTGFEFRGEMLPWTFLFGHKLRANYQYDPDKIKTDFDQIVHK